MISLLMVFSLVCGTVLQAMSPTWSWLGQAHLPLLLGLVLYYAFTHDDMHMIVCALLAGILQDSMDLIPLGYSSFCFCVVGLTVSRFRDLVFVRQWITHLLIGAAAAGGVSLALSVLLLYNDGLIIGPLRLLLKTVGSIFLGAMVVPVEFQVMESLDRMLGNAVKEEN
ncbi:MAG: hypothetical protein V2A34_12305 [Lentisphaerota bacterium]